jgi:inhibitor of cysteine peptidase
MSKGKALIWLIIILIIIAILVVGGWFVYANYYTKSSPANNEVSENRIPANIEVSENQENIEIVKGQEFTIKFVSNASTGYSWMVDESYEKNIINSIGNEYKDSNSGMVGAPGEEFWTFKGINKGNTKLNFSYARSWEEGSKPENTKVFNITVK